LDEDLPLEIDFGKIVDNVLTRISKKKMNIVRHNEVTSPITERMIDELLKVDTSFFKQYRYNDSTQQVRAARENIDRLI
jgi:hypothetical protein